MFEPEKIIATIVACVGRACWVALVVAASSAGTGILAAAGVDARAAAPAASARAPQLRDRDVILRGIMFAFRDLALQKNDELAPNLEDFCQRYGKRIQATYQGLSQLVDEQELRPENAAIRLARLDPLACEDAEQRRRLVNAVVEVFSERGKRMALLLATDTNPAHAYNLREGVAAAVNGAVEVVVRDLSKEKPARLAALLALRHEVAVALIGQKEGQAAEVIQYLAAALIPSFVLAPEQSLAPNVSLPGRSSRDFWRVFPSEGDLARTLIRHAQRERMQKIAVLQPTNRANRLASYLRALGREVGITVAADIPYAAGEYISMDGAVQTLLRIDYRERADEFRDLVERKRAELKDQTIGFDPKQVVLPPRVDFDAIFIDDDYRGVRNLIRILQYHGLARARLVGAQGWRGGGLIDPPEPFLDGSVFVDFVGSYDSLPGSLAVVSDGFIADITAAQSADIKLIGFRAASLALQLVIHPAHRLDWAGHTHNTPPDARGFFEGVKAFDSRRVSLWPTFLFSVQGSKIAARDRFIARAELGAAVAPSTPLAPGRGRTGPGALTAPRESPK